MVENITDKYGNDIYITDEHWEHIYKRHPEIIGFEQSVIKTIRTGDRKEMMLEPGVFRYSKTFLNLPNSHSHIVVIIKFEQQLASNHTINENNFVITAYMKQV